GWLTASCRRGREGSEVVFALRKPAVPCLRRSLRGRRRCLSRAARGRLGTRTALCRRALAPGQIANELNSVAQALFRVNENGPAFQRRAVPARLSERAWHNVGLRPALLVILPPFLEIPLHQVQQRTLVERPYVFLIKPQRFFGMVQCFFEQ